MSGAFCGVCGPERAREVTWSGGLSFRWKHAAWHEHVGRRLAPLRRQPGSRPGENLGFTRPVAAAAYAVGNCERLRVLELFRLLEFLGCFLGCHVISPLCSVNHSCRGRVSRSWNTTRGAFSIGSLLGKLHIRVDSQRLGVLELLRTLQALLSFPGFLGCHMIFPPLSSPVPGADANIYANWAPMSIAFWSGR